MELLLSQNLQENSKRSNEKSFSLPYRHKLRKFDQFIVRNRCHDLKSLKYHFRDALKPFDRTLVPTKGVVLFGFSDLELVDDLLSSIFAPLLDGQEIFIKLNHQFTI